MGHEIRWRSDECADCFVVAAGCRLKEWNVPPQESRQSQWYRMSGPCASVFVLVERWELAVSYAIELSGQIFAS
jgi:hypothetical protein